MLSTTFWNYLSAEQLWIKKILSQPACPVTWDKDFSTTAGLEHIRSVTII